MFPQVILDIYFLVLDFYLSDLSIYKTSSVAISELGKVSNGVFNKIILIRGGEGRKREGVGRPLISFTTFVLHMPHFQTNKRYKNEKKYTGESHYTNEPRLCRLLLGKRSSQNTKESEFFPMNTS